MANVYISKKLIIRMLIYTMFIGQPRWYELLVLHAAPQPSHLIGSRMTSAPRWGHIATVQMFINLIEFI